MAERSLAATYPILSTNEMKLVNNKEVDILHILSLLPPPREHVPVLRRTHNHITLRVGSKFKNTTFCEMYLWMILILTCTSPTGT